MSPANSRSSDTAQQQGQAPNDPEQLWKVWMGHPFPHSIETQGSDGSGDTHMSSLMNAGPAKTAQPPSTPADIPKIIVSPGAPPGPWTSCQSNITGSSPNSQGSMTKSPGPLTLPPNTQCFSLGHVQTGYGQHKLTLRFDPAASGATSPVIQDNPGYDGMSDASDSEGTQSSPIPRTANIGPHREPDAWRDGIGSKSSGGDLNEAMVKELARWRAARASRQRVVT